jgi:hypothetical protein
MAWKTAIEPEPRKRQGIPGKPETEDRAMSALSSIIARAEMFARRGCFSSAARRDLRANREIWKRYCPALGALDLGHWPLPGRGGGGAFWGKQGFEEATRV